MYMLFTGMIDSMITLPLLVMIPSPCLIHIKINKLDLTVMVVVAIQVSVWGLPTVAFSMGPGGDMMTTGGTGSDYT